MYTFSIKITKCSKKTFPTIQNSLSMPPNITDWLGVVSTLKIHNFKLTGNMDTLLYLNFNTYIHYVGVQVILTLCQLIHQKRSAQFVVHGYGAERN